MNADTDVSNMASLPNSTDQNTNDWFRKVYEHANDAILVIDPEEEAITDCNSTTRELFEYPEEELSEVRPAEMIAEWEDRRQEVYDDLIGEDGGLTEEFTCKTYTGRKLQVELSLSSITIDGQPHLLAVCRDRTQTRRQQTQLRKRAAALEEATDGIAIVDRNGKIEDANPAFAEMYGYDDPDQLRSSDWSRLYEDDEWDVIETEVLPTVQTAGNWSGEVQGLRRDGTTFPQVLSVSTFDDGGFVCSTCDISDRKKHARKVEALNEAVHDLVVAEDSDTVARITIDIVDDVLGFDVSCVRLFDEERNALELAAMTDEAEALVESCRAFDLGLSSAGRAYRQEQRIEQTIDNKSGPDLEAKAQLHFPLDDYGTLTVYSRSSTIDDIDLHCIEMLASSVTTSLQRTEREQALREKKRELSQQHAELETLNGINCLIQQLIQQLLDTTTLDEVYQTVCDRIVSSEFYESAWIGTIEIEDGKITETTGAGVSDEYLELVRSAPLTQFADGIVAEAIRTRSPQLIRRRKEWGGGSERDQSDGSASETTVAVPISNGEKSFGILVVTSTRDGAFRDTALGGFEVLADVVGFLITSTLNKELLHTDNVVKLEFGVTDSQCLPAVLSQTLDCQIRLRGTTQRNDRTVLCYLDTTCDSPDEARAVAEEIDLIEDCSIVERQTEGILLEVITAMPVVRSIADVGASITEIIATDGEARIIVEGLPGNSHDIVQVLDDCYDDVELIAKQREDRPVETTGALREQLAETLTDRQRAAIETALAAGYYNSPRKRSAEEISDAMDIASSTLHQHLRKAERKILSSVLEDTRDRSE